MWKPVVGWGSEYEEEVKEESEEEVKEVKEEEEGW